MVLRPSNSNTRLDLDLQGRVVALAEGTLTLAAVRARELPLFESREPAICSGGM